MPLSSTFNLGVLARTKNSMHPRGSRYPSSPVPPLYPMHTRGPLRPLPDGVPHRVVDAWRDLRVWGGVDVEVGGLRPPPPPGGGWGTLVLPLHEVTGVAQRKSTTPTLYPPPARRLTAPIAPYTVVPAAPV